MFEELFDEFTDLIKELYRTEINPVGLARKICESKNLTYDEKVDWLDRLAEYCDNNYRSEDKKTPADKVNDIASYFQLTVGSLYTDFSNNSDGLYRYKVITYDKGKEISTVYFDTLSSALDYVPESKCAILHKVFADRDNKPKLKSKDLKTLSTRFIYSNYKWVYDVYSKTANL